MPARAAVAKNNSRERHRGRKRVCKFTAEAGSLHAETVQPKRAGEACRNPARELTGKSPHLNFLADRAFRRFNGIMKKILRWGLIAILLLIVLGALAVHFFLDGAIKHGVETKGPELARVDVKLEGVHISPLSGSGNLKGLLIGNPEGYKSPHAITVSNASLALKPASLLGDKLIIHSINLQAPDINLEIGLGGNNLSKILDNLNQTTAGSSPNEKEKEKKEGRKMQVDDFLISGAKVH